MMQDWRGEHKYKEWSDSFVWLNPLEISVDGRELHWNKISPDDARESFRVINRMEPFLRQAKIQTGADVRTWRECLANLAENGAPAFNETELRFFDLYYGSDRIKVEKYDGKYDVVNGRHRLWLAAQDGITGIPVSLKEKTIYQLVPTRGHEDSTMSNYELNDIESEVQEQEEQAEDLNRQIEQHEERVDKWATALQELKQLNSDVSSDALRNAEASAEKGKTETESKLRELTEQREQLLEENQEKTEKVREAYDGRTKAMDKIGILEIVSGEASNDEKSFIEDVKGSLMSDMGKLAELDGKLNDIRKKLEQK